MVQGTPLNMLAINIFLDCVTFWIQWYMILFIILNVVLTQYLEEGDGKEPLFSSA